MIIYWGTHGGGGATSTDPGITNVRAGTTYSINGTNYTGTAQLNTYSELTITGQSTSATLTSQDLD